jgi:hypothetical protein
MNIGQDFKIFNCGLAGHGDAGRGIHGRGHDDISDRGVHGRGHDDVSSRHGDAGQVAMVMLVVALLVVVYVDVAMVRSTSPATVMPDMVAEG